MRFSRSIAARSVRRSFSVSDCGEWTATALETAVKAHAEKSGIKLGKLAQPLRAALTGTSTSPPIFDVLDVLGREEAMGRINDLLN